MSDTASDHQDALILAIETSAFEGSAALSRGRKLIDYRPLAQDGRRHAQTLVYEVDELLKKHSLKPSDIDAVAVSVGPGSFTGLRVGVTFAKTFAWANDAKLIAVDTLRAVAQQIDLENASSSTVVVVCDAQRNELFFNEYTWDTDTSCWQPLGSVRIEPADGFSERRQATDVLLTGPGLQKHAEAIGSCCSCSPEDGWLPKATTVADVGAVMLQHNSFADPYQLEPVYIRRSYAEEKADAAG